jgi:hypothetical protein
MASYRTIQITPKEYELLMRLQRHLLRWGTRSIEETAGGEFTAEKALSDLDRDGLAKGAVAGLSMALTLHLLERREKEEKE